MEMKPMKETYTGEPTLDSREVAEMIGNKHKELLRKVDGYIQILESAKLRSQDFFIEQSYKTEGNNKTYKRFDITKMGCEMVANKLTGRKGVLFTAAYVKKFNEMESGNRILSVSVIGKERLEEELIGVKYASDVLRLDSTSRIRMLETVYGHHQLPTDTLPSYVDEECTESISALLKDNGVPISAAKANTKLIHLGILEIKERPSSEGGTKEFKSVTKKGLYFGKNLINPKNPRETQPHYYPSKFPELMRLIGDAS